MKYDIVPKQKTSSDQRPKKSELSRWQNSTRTKFPDEVHKSFFATNKVHKSFCDKKVCKLFFETNKLRKSFS